MQSPYRQPEEYYVKRAAKYHPYTATGKLKADITPTTPRGLGAGYYVNNDRK